MTKLHGFDFFPSGQVCVAIEPRRPQIDFPEHVHDFSEIVIVEKGTGTHVFNGQPYMLSGGSVCFVRDHDRHLYEHAESLHLTNVLYRSPGEFTFLSGLDKLLPKEQDGHYPSHWRIGQSVMYQAKRLIAQLEQQGDHCEPDAIAGREILFMQLLILLRKGGMAEGREDDDGRLNHLIFWLEDHFAEDICWETLAERFSFSLRTLHRQLKLQTGLSPQRYLNRLRLSRAHHLLRHSDASVTDIAFQCGFGDSNHFSTLFKREYAWSPRDVRLRRDTPLQ